MKKQEIKENRSDQIKLLQQNSVSLETVTDLRTKLDRQKPLKVKIGFDPTAPDLHLGHLVQINKLNDFLRLGHEVIVIIGDATALVGDPTGRSRTRPALSRQEIEASAKTYLEQLKKVLAPGHLTVRRNSEWINKLEIADLIKYLSKFTVARLLERDDFSKRYKGGEPIFLHEMLYIFLQAYDSVVVQSDIELGGTDQLFNLLAGRELMRDMGLEPQVCMTLPLLVGTDGRQKMSKSLGNYIGITEQPYSIFSKVMSIPDKLMNDYFRLVAGLSEDEIKSIYHQFSNDQRNIKMKLAGMIVEKLHSDADAASAREKWVRTFSKREYSEPEAVLRLNKADLKDGNKIWIVDLVHKTGIFNSKGEVRRLIQQGGLEINKKRFTNIEENIEVASGTILKIGKKNRVFLVEVSD